MPAIPSTSALLTSLSAPPPPPSQPNLLLRRQQNAVIAIPAQYAGLNSGPAPGAVAGIVLGSVAAFLFIIWLLWIASTGGGFLRSSRLTEEEVVVRHRSRSPGTVHRSHRSTRARTEMTSRSPRRERGDRVIRTERIVRDAGPAAPMGREPSRIRESVFVDETIASSSRLRLVGKETEKWTSNTATTKTRRSTEADPGKRCEGYVGKETEEDCHGTSTSEDKGTEMSVFERRHRP
ncbi:uncharacterized protein MYCGRDRAFT_94097 [Zymoseptoria tritici IPO323]|uniref:Uncharacterized protein n=1 Tax=Zymoseptoria tritici (strain CBS 115943 / IPO323) TaxID=336722 RepID=F9XE58_ZYMTI|nr:uncharacterized protein MYCGRDRAFT_94097 [Zymoseptoria tritici IPO323]EGP86594.1 hypothetical protein MYCGRDRAFT_94097 [Zymoseptoria tritici IPO323]